MADRPSVTRVVKFIRKGEQGDSAAYIELSRTAILYDANSNGYSTSQQAFEITLYLKVNNSNCSIASTNNIVVTTISNVTVTKNSTSKITLTVANNKQVSGVVTIQMTGTLNGKSYSASIGVSIGANKGGIGISSITEYYLATASSSGVTTSTSGWTTTVQTVTATKKYLWNYEVVTYTDGSTTTTTPVIIGTYGDKGDTGDSAPVALASPDKITIPCYNGGTVKSQTITGITFSLKVGANTATVTSCADGTKPTGVTVQGVYTNAVTITVGTNATASGMAAGVTFTITGTYGGKTYSATVTVALIGTIEGPQGNPGNPGGQGNRGPALRGPQDWNVVTENGTVSYQFYQGAEGEPYLDFVIYNGYFYVCKKSHTNKNYLPTNTTYWTLSDKVAMIAASVLFAEHGYFGDAIISGQWLISANGTIEGTTYTKGQTFQGELAYSLFNADSPLGVSISKYYNTDTSTLGSSATTLNKATVSLEAGRVYKLTCVGYSSNASNPCYVRLVKTDDSSVVITPVNLNSTSSVTRSGYAHVTQTGSYYIQLYHSSTGATGTVTSCQLVEDCFAPFYALNLRTGKTYQQDVYVKGGIRSPFTYLGQGGTFNNDFSDNVAVYSASQSTYALPWTTDQSGRKVVITNYYWNGNYSTASGYAQLTAPSGKYFYEDGVQKSTIKLSREAVELLGYGDSSSFYGWIVLKRIDLGTQNRYGHPMKMLAVGRVTGTGSGASVSYHTFDGSTMSVTRNGEGTYTVSWSNSGWFASSDHVFAIATGGSNSNGDGHVFASITNRTTTSITVKTADDSSLNDGTFNFFIMNFNDWIYL